MMQTLLKALKGSSSISAWKVNSIHTISTELFYVQRAVETNRATDVVDYSVTIYVDKEGKRGESTFTVYPYMDEKEINGLIEENVFAAGFTLNTYFDLPSSKDKVDAEVQSNLADMPFAELIGKVGKAIMDANHFENGSLSATEIFLNKATRRVINSNGVDASSTSYECKIETIPNWVKGEEEVELYKSIEFSHFDPEALTKEVEQTLLLAKARSIAIPLKDVGVLPVILENDEVSQVFGAFASDLSYLAKYFHRNHFELGEDIQPSRTGDALNIELRPEVDGALGSRLVDDDGVFLKPVRIIQDGKVIALHGAFKEGYYLGEKSPTGKVPVLVVPSGDTSIEDLKKQKHVRCVRFSDMQLDIDSGLLGGEVRLGFYFDGEKEIPVTGFSIQADFHQMKSEFKTSKEMVVLPEYAGPKYLFIPNVKIG